MLKKEAKTGICGYCSVVKRTGWPLMRLRFSGMFQKALLFQENLKVGAGSSYYNSRQIWIPL